MIFLGALLEGYSSYLEKLTRDIHESFGPLPLVYMREGRLGWVRYRLEPDGRYSRTEDPEELRA